MSRPFLLCSCPPLTCPVLSRLSERLEGGTWGLPHPWRDAQETIRQPVAQGLKGAKFSVACVWGEGRGSGRLPA